MQKMQKMQKIKIKNYLFTSKIVDEPESIALGMMGKTFDKTFNAMLFLLEKMASEPEPYSPTNMYEDFSKKEKQRFWMKNCIIPLDMIFIKNNTITKIHHSCPPCNTKNCKNYCGTANMVIETNGGTCQNLNIKEGDFVEFLK